VLRSAPLLLLLSACATPPAKMSFEELYASQPMAAPPVAAPVDELVLVAEPLQPPTAEEVRAALEDFAARSRAVRAQVLPGSAMHPLQVENWQALQGVLRAWMRLPVRETPLEEVQHARAVLEAELGEDARVYGDIPAHLAEAVLARLDRLEVREARLRPRRRRKPNEPVLLAWPVHPIYITSPFGIRRHPITGVTREHLGLDLAAKRGQVVFAAAAGWVVRAGWNGSHGLQVELQHDDGLRTRYSHLSQALVAAGETLEQGDALGLAGKTGLATGVHLHFELWREGQPRDPLEELEPLLDGGEAEEPRASSSAPWPAGSRWSSRP
jgi:murein DD-endopeptidase MepM/ murein hydrolase activator NlpD